MLTLDRASLYSHRASLNCLRSLTHGFHKILELSFEILTHPVDFSPGAKLELTIRIW